MRGGKKRKKKSWLTGGGGERGMHIPQFGVYFIYGGFYRFSVPAARLSFLPTYGFSQNPSPLPPFSTPPGFGQKLPFLQFFFRLFFPAIPGGEGGGVV